MLVRVANGVSRDCARRPERQDVVIELRASGACGRRLAALDKSTTQDRPGPLASSQVGEGRRNRRGSRAKVDASDPVRPGCLVARRR